MASTHDINHDGIITESDLRLSREMMEINLREEKAETQKKMAWIAVVSMLVFTIGLFSPIISDSRVQALSDLLGLFYIAQAGIVGAYMSVTMWMSTNATSQSIASRNYNIYESSPRHDLPDGES